MTNLILTKTRDETSDSSSACVIISHLQVFLSFRNCKCLFNDVFSVLQVIRTVTASVATVPVSLATVSTCNPVSGNPVSIAGCPSVSMAPPAQILAPSQQILGILQFTPNHTQFQKISHSFQLQQIPRLNWQSLTVLRPN